MSLSASHPGLLERQEEEDSLGFLKPRGNT